MTREEIDTMRTIAAEIVSNYQGVGGYSDETWPLECSRYNLAVAFLQVDAELTKLTEAS